MFTLITLGLVLLIALFAYRYKRFNAIILLFIALFIALPLQIVLGLVNACLILLLSRSNIKINAGKAFRSANFNINNNPHMSQSEAYEVLGLTKDASKEEIIASYKKLIMHNHPDKGGSKYIAQKIIAAKKCLLNEGE